RTATPASYGHGMTSEQLSATRVDPGSATRVVVVGAGMVAHRFVESLLARAGDGWHLTVLGEEDRPPYDRVGLTSYFAGATPEDLTLDRSPLVDPRVDFRSGDAVVRVDRRARRVTTRGGTGVDYDHLVLATGSYAVRLPVDGAELDGCFVYRTLDDVERLRSYVQERSAELGRPLRGAVIGGGLLGLEAAGALQELDVACTVLQATDRLMS